MLWSINLCSDSRLYFNQFFLYEKLKFNSIRLLKLEHILYARLGTRKSQLQSQNRFNFWIILERLDMQFCVLINKLIISNGVLR